MEPVKAPWIRPAGVFHDPSVDVDDMLARFALTLKQRGFRISGFVQVNNRQVHDGDEGCADRIDLLHLDASPGNGAAVLRGANGRIMVVGVFPGLTQILPTVQVIEAQPRPGELPTIVIDTVLPGCAVAVISATTVINRTLPRLVKLIEGARVALIGPAPPMSPRRHSYGIEVLGALRVRDVEGLARTVASGGQPRDFKRFGEFVHVGVGRSNPAEHGSAVISLMIPRQPKTAGTTEHRNAVLARR